MLKKKLAVAVLGALMFSPIVLPRNNFLPMSIVCAEVRTIEADGYYIMGDGTEENQAVAKERARNDAKRAASEQACIFIETSSVLQNDNLSRDEIRTISASILKIISDPVKLETNGDSIIFHCHITALADTANINDKFLRDRQKLDELVRQNNEQAKQISKLNAEIDSLKKKFANAPAEEKIQIKDEIKRNEQQFTAAQYNEKGAEYYISGNYIKAIEFYSKAIELNPNYDSAWFNIYFMNGNSPNQLKKNIEYFDKMTKLNPQSEIAWYGLGSAYSALGTIFYSKGYKKTNHIKSLEYYKQSIECFNKVLAINPLNDKALCGLGYVYRYTQNDKYQKSTECILKAIEINPNNEWALIYLGQNYEFLDKYSSALECYEQVLKLNPGNQIAEMRRNFVSARMK